MPGSLSAFHAPRQATGSPSPSCARLSKLSATELVTLFASTEREAVSVPAVGFQAIANCRHLDLNGQTGYKDAKSRHSPPSLQRSESCPFADIEGHEIRAASASTLKPVLGKRLNRFLLPLEYKSVELIRPEQKSDFFGRRFRAAAISVCRVA